MLFVIVATLVCGMIAGIIAGCLGRMMRNDRGSRGRGLSRLPMGLICLVFTGLAACVPGLTNSPIWGGVFFWANMALLVVTALWYAAHVRNMSAAWWYAHRARWIGEWLLFTVLCAIIVWSATNAAHIMGQSWSDSALSWGFYVIPWILGTAIVGGALTLVPWKLYLVASRRGSGYGGGWRALAIVLTIATLIGCVVVGFAGDGIAGLTPLQTMASTNSPEKTTEATMSSQELEEAIEDLHKLSAMTPEELEELTVRKYSGISKEMLLSSLTPCDKARTDAAGFSDALTFPYEGKTDEKRFAELEEEILRNPVVGVAYANAIRDKKLGGTTFGEISPWMNEMVNKFEKDGNCVWCEYGGGGTDSTICVNAQYRQYAARLCSLMERFILQGVQAKPVVEHWPLNDTVENNLRAGVKSTEEYEKPRDALILAYVTKAGHTLFVMGSNIHDKRPEFYGEDKPETPNKPKSDTPSGGSTPKTTPTPTTTPGPSPTTPKPTTVPSPTTTPKPTTPNPTYNKDKSLSDNSGKNDDPGPGPDTNNGVGATESRAGRPSNSDHMSPTQYEQTIQNLIDVNASQKTGKDDSTPSSYGGSNTTVDNNGAAANKASPTVAKQQAVANDPEPQQWDGPDV